MILKQRSRKRKDIPLKPNKRYYFMAMNEFWDAAMMEMVKYSNEKPNDYQFKLYKPEVPLSLRYTWTKKNRRRFMLWFIREFRERSSTGRSRKTKKYFDYQTITRNAVNFIQFFGFQIKETK